MRKRGPEVQAGGLAQGARSELQRPPAASRGHWRSVCVPVPVCVCVCVYARVYSGYSRGYKRVLCTWGSYVSGDHVLGVSVVLFARGFCWGEVLGFED